MPWRSHWPAGSWTVRRWTLDVSLNVNGRDFPSVSLESNPEGDYFDLAFVNQLLATCAENGWDLL